MFGADRTAQQRQQKYFQVDADSDEYSVIVDDTHEAVQVLHHAYVYGFDCVLLLVGNNAGGILYGVFVHVSKELRDAYGNVLHDIYRNALQWIYCQDEEDAGEEPTGAPSKKELGSVLACITNNKAEVDLYSFEMETALWQDVNFNFDFPLPRMKSILPLVFATWNSIKGGSDATTNLIWHCKFAIPRHNSNQAIAVGQLLSVAGVHVHRLLQISSAKADLDKYSCLKRFRDSASERMSHKKSLFLIIDYITALFRPTEPEEAAAAAAPPVTPPRASRRSASVLRVELPMIQCGKTPMKNVAAKYTELEERLVSGRIDAPSKLVLERSKMCVGYPIYCIGTDGKPNGPGGRGTCAYCMGPTHWKCLLCKRWLCTLPSEHALALENWKPVVIFNPTHLKPTHCQNNCFQVVHRDTQVSDVLQRDKKLRLSM